MNERVPPSFCQPLVTALLSAVRALARGGVCGGHKHSIRNDCCDTQRRIEKEGYADRDCAARNSDLQ